MPPVRRRVSLQSVSSSGEEKPPVRRRRQVQPVQPVQQVQPQKRPVQRQQRPQRQRVRTPEPDYDDRPTPLLLRVLMWFGVILLCFVLGYLGTSWVMDLLNRKLLLKPENRIENQEDLTDFQEAEQERASREAIKSGANVQQVSLNLYHVNNDSLAETRKNFVSRTTEDNIRDAVEEILTLSSIPNAGKIKLLHVFKVSDTAFLDMPGQFASSLETAGQKKSLLLLTGIVRTLQENFSPVTQVRFLIDSKTPKSGGVVDLSAPWKMPKRS